jgi:hypothetical protein
MAPMAVGASGPRYSVYFLLSPFCCDSTLTHTAKVRPVSFSFEKLLVYRQAVAFAHAVCAATTSC